MATNANQLNAAKRFSERKIVIVHKRALVGKYTLAGYSRIMAALDALVTDDGVRGIKTKIVLVDSMVPKGGVAAAVARNAGKFKSAVDYFYKGGECPDFLVLLGGPDVIPHIPLRSPWGKVVPFGEESVVESDLPYASDRAHTLDPSKFQNAPRKVGRIPDVPGSSDPAYLIDRINEVITAPSINAAQHFSLSADVWKGASGEIATRLFGPGAVVHCSPSLGPAWPSKILKKPIQYINCHGDTKKDVFYGEKAGVKGAFPHAINTAALVKKVVHGAVVVAECCYGAELFHPSLPHEPQGMALTYLEQGATTFLGSSTVSYGGSQAVDLACADEICLFFLEGVLKGNSCGAALADARRRLVEGEAILDNYQIKTLAQFMLFGDPSRRPVKSASKQVTKHALGMKAAKALNVGSRVGGPPTPKTSNKVRLLPVASQPIQGGSVSGIPMPKGVPYTANLYTSADRQARVTGSGPGAEGLSPKGQPGMSVSPVDPTLSVLVVSIPNDPHAISEMRRAWGQAETLGPVARSLVRKTAVMQEVTEAQASWVVGEVTPYAAIQLTPHSAVSGRPYSFSSRAAARLRPHAVRKFRRKAVSAGTTHPGQPERNSRVVLVARIANGQIQSYKVLVAR